MYTQVIDHVSELSIKHHYHHQVNPNNYYSNPTTSFKTDSFMIPCRALDMFLKGLMRLILLWWCSTIHSSSNTITYHTNTSENSIDQTIVNGILESKEINAFLVRFYIIKFVKLYLLLCREKKDFLLGLY